MLKLTKVTFEHTPRIPGLRAGSVSELDIDNPPTPLLGWSVHVRAHAIVLVSPRGWTSNENRATKRDPNGPITIHEIPRAGSYLHWIGDEADVEAVLKGGKYDTPNPLGWRPAPVEADKPILSQIPASQVGDA
jgi:hypothetical protein